MYWTLNPLSKGSESYLVSFGNMMRWRGFDKDPQHILFYLR